MDEKLHLGLNWGLIHVGIKNIHFTLRFDINPERNKLTLENQLKTLRKRFEHTIDKASIIFALS